MKEVPSLESRTMSFLRFILIMLEYSFERYTLDFEIPLSLKS